VIATKFVFNTRKLVLADLYVEVIMKCKFGTGKDGTSLLFR
jgi:hypothetical protein